MGRSRPIEVRFSEKVWRTEGCWIWCGSQIAFGHGRIGHNGRVTYAHRVSWELYRGPIPMGLCVCHKCDVPQCVNPDHLFLGTHTDNMRDMASKGRTGVHRGESNAHHSLTSIDVRFIRHWSEVGFAGAEIGNAFGIAKTTANRIIARRAWAHIL
jgi:hypothetical protein